MRCSKKYSAVDVDTAYIFPGVRCAFTKTHHKEGNMENPLEMVRIFIEGRWMWVSQDDEVLNGKALVRDRAGRLTIEEHRNEDKFQLLESEKYGLLPEEMP